MKPIQFLREARAELKKVSWPSREEVTNSTMVVIVALIIFSIFLWAVDSALFRIIGVVLSNG